MRVFLSGRVMWMNDFLAAWSSAWLYLVVSALAALLLGTVWGMLHRRCLGRWRGRALGVLPRCLSIRPELVSNGKVTEECRRPGRVDVAEALRQAAALDSGPA